MAVIQVTPVVRATGSPLVASLVFPAPVTAGNSVAVALHQAGNGNRTFAVTEGGSATGWASVYQFTPVSTGVSRFFGRPNHPGGEDTFDVGHGQASGEFAGFAIEYEGPSTLNLVDFAEYLDPAVTDFHRASELGLTTGDAVLGLLTAGSNLTNFTNGVPKSGSGWTKVGGTDQSFFFAYQEFPSGTTAQLGEWDSTGADRVARSGMVLLGTDAPSGGGGAIGRASRSWWFGL